jgi:hypothetical protein
MPTIENVNGELNSGTKYLAPQGENTPSRQVARAQVRHNKKQFLGYLHILDPMASKFTFQFFNDRVTGKDAKTFTGTPEEIWAEILARNTEERAIGVFVTVNETDLRGRKKENIFRVRALFVDADGQDQVDRCLGIIRATGAIPTMVVRTSPGKAHFYWRCDDVPLANFEARQNALIQKFGTDQSVTDLPRVMRVAGGLHLKDPGCPCEVTFKATNPDKTWRADELFAMLGLSMEAGRTHAATKRAPSGKNTHAGNPTIQSVFEQPPLPGTGTSFSARIAAGAAKVKAQALAEAAILGAGIETSRYAFYRNVSVDVQHDIAWYAVSVLAEKTNTFKGGKAGDYMGKYARAGLALARSGLSGARDIWREFNEAAEGKDTREAIDRKFDDFVAAPVRPGDANVNVETLFFMAEEAGADFTPWKGPVAIAAAAVVAAATPQALAVAVQKREPLVGGEYGALEFIDRANQHYVVGTSLDEVGVFRIRPDGALAHVPGEQFKIALANVFVEVPDGKNGTKRLPAEKYWLQSSKRHERTLVFKPAGDVEPGEYNEWRGFAVDPSRGRGNMRRLLRHIWKLVCRRDKVKFKYVIRWLAWAVQHPDKAPGTVIVLMSEVEGTGKSTIGNVMCCILGQHGIVIADKERLLGKFNAHMETVVFILADEILWAGNAAERDKLESMITSPTLTIEAKYRGAHERPNHLHMIMTSNHQHAVGLGTRDRRYVVLDVDDKYALGSTRCMMTWKMVGMASSCTSC